MANSGSDLKGSSSAAITLVEVGPRDGLQNEAVALTAADKITLVNKLTAAGFKRIETGSFVSPKWVPQMASTAEVFRNITRAPGVSYSALAPNMRGLEDAVAAEVNEVAVFLAVTDEFSQRNINCTMAESLERIKPVIKAALAYDLPVRGYLSCVLGCPYAGKVDNSVVASMTEALINAGCYEVSLGDTIGIGTPAEAYELINHLKASLPVDQLAAHFHDTYGQAVANIHAVLPLGITVIDTAVAGLGGCPYAKGATGNVATEDVLYMLEGMNIETGIDMHKLLEANRFISDKLGRSSTSRAASALLAKED